MKKKNVIKDYNATIIKMKYIIYQVTDIKDYEISSKMFINETFY